MHFVKLRTILILLFLAGYLAACNTTEENDSKKIAIESNEDKLDEAGIDDDIAFLVEISSAMLMEIELGKLASRQGQSPKVKEYGASMVTDHESAKQELDELALKKNITLPNVPGNKELDRINELAKKTGEAFDKAYMETIVKDHEKDIELYQREAETGKDPEIRAFATAKLADLIQHLQTASTIQTSLEKK